MIRGTCVHRPQLAGLALVGIMAWVVTIVLPLGGLYLTLRPADLPDSTDLSLSRYAGLLGRSCLLAAAVATCSLAAGWPAARVLAAGGVAATWGPIVLAATLLIPPQVVYYAWGLLLLPTSSVGQWLARSEFLTAWAAPVRAVLAMGLWYWPLCALLVAIGWRRTDPHVWDQAALDATTWRRWWSVGFHLLRPTLAAAWAVTFVLVVAQFSVFHLAAIDTLGTELATLYQLTGNIHTMAWAAIPLLIPAVVVAVVAARFIQPVSQRYDLRSRERVSRQCWILAIFFWTLTTIVPTVLLITNLRGVGTFVRFGRLSCDALLAGAAIAAGAAALAIVIASGIWAAAECGFKRTAAVMRCTTFVTALLPGSLVGAAMVLAFNRPLLADWLYDRPWIVSIGHAARLSVLAVLVLAYVRASLPTELNELARLDGTGPWRTAWSVYLPGLWPALVAAALVTFALSITELSATMVLLPAGVPNFAQNLLNQMHYAREQQVIASCILLIAFAAAVMTIVVVTIRLAGKRILAPLLLLGLVLTGCDTRSGQDGAVDVVRHFGTTGRGEAQFIYPRAITIAGDDTLFVVDKAARVQHLAPDGRYLGEWTMPKFKSGKPVGISCGPDGRVYVADTHYHRVMVYSPDGKLISQFGAYGTGPGQFIYPTDVAVAPDGRIFVSEYGGNDRISIFTPKHQFIRSFGTFGEGENELSRPSAICIDRKRRVLYVADACNHRIVRYDLKGRWLGAFGRPGTEPGQLRYPYDVNVLDDGSIIVCEYGNHRVQRFDPDGRSLGTFGQAGRDVGRVLHPWGAAVDSQQRVFVVDSGNNRIQVWRF